MAQQSDGPRRNALDRLLAKASADPAFRSQLLTDTPAALAAVGLRAPPGIALKVVEDSPTLVHLVLPVSGTLSEQDLGRVSGGATTRADWTTVPGKV